MNQHTQPTAAELKQHVGSIRIGGDGKPESIGVDLKEEALTVPHFTRNGKERRPFTQKDLDAKLKLHDFNKRQEMATSEAKKKILGLLGTDTGPKVKRIETPEGDEFFIRHLDAEGMIRVGLLSARSADGKLFLEREGHFGALLAALILVATCEDETGDSPLFESREDAYEFAHSTNPEAVKISAFLFQEIVDFNPDILPKPPEPKKLVAGQAPPMPESEEEDAFLEQSETGQAPLN